MWEGRVRRERARARGWVVVTREGGAGIGSRMVGPRIEVADSGYRVNLCLMMSVVQGGINDLLAGGVWGVVSSSTLLRAFG